jgi:hypothetical protein
MSTMSVRMSAVGGLGRVAQPRWATVRVETDNAVYVGRVYVPETRKRLSDLLSDDRPFLNLTDVTINGEESTPEPYVAINKRDVRTMRVLDEGEAEIQPVSENVAAGAAIHVVRT